MEVTTENHTISNVQMMHQVEIKGTSRQLQDLVTKLQTRGSKYLKFSKFVFDIPCFSIPCAFGLLL
eukprot:scaffold17174_cov75-Cyclotella_meneghiniana.AAC.1